VENQLRLNNYPIEAKEFGEVVKIVALVRKGNEDKLLQLIADATAAQAQVQSIGELYLDAVSET
jgi:hypothetical protein